MPTHFNNCDVYMFVGGEKYRLNGIEEIELTSTTLDDDEYNSFYEESTGTFWINMNSKMGKQYRRLLYRGTNNWRKMHGLPMHRYCQ